MSQPHTVDSDRHAQLDPVFPCGPAARTLLPRSSRDASAGVPAPGPQRALVVFESLFGCTEEVAHAVAEGLRLEGVATVVVEVGSDTPSRVPAVDLLVVGGPTHAFSLSHSRTRAEAVVLGAAPVKAKAGLREWLTTFEVPPASASAQRVATFDTRMTRMGPLPSTASHAAARLVRRGGGVVEGRSRSFRVEDLRGPVCEGELDRAVEWGKQLGARTRVRAASRQARVDAAGH